MTQKLPRIHREAFTVESDEGLAIRGVLEIPENPETVVVLIHGFKGFKEWGFFPWLSRYLAEEGGLAVCRFDFSRNGISSDGADVFDRLDLFADDTYSTQLADLRVVVRHLARHSALESLDISLLGYSRGGAVAILGAHEVPRLRSVATWSAIASLDRWDERTISDWNADGFTTIVNARTKQEMKISRKLHDDYMAHRDELDVLRCARDLHVPLLVVHGSMDETVDVGDARKIAAAARDSSLAIIRSATHSFCAIHPLVDVPWELELAAEVTSSFLNL